MPRRTFNQRFLAALRKAYSEANKYGGRSTQKIKVLHGWVQDELRLVLGTDYDLTGQSLPARKKNGFLEHTTTKRSMSSCQGTINRWR